MQASSFKEHILERFISQKGYVFRLNPPCRRDGEKALVAVHAWAQVSLQPLEKRLVEAGVLREIFRTVWTWKTRKIIYRSTPSQ